MAVVLQLADDLVQIDNERREHGRILQGFKIKQPRFVIRRNHVVAAFHEKFPGLLVEVFEKSFEPLEIVVVLFCSIPHSKLVLRFRKLKLNQKHTS